MAASIGSGNSSNYKKYRDKLRSLMAGHNPLGYFMSVDYKEDEHSNHVIRSFIFITHRCGFLILRGRKSLIDFCPFY